MYSITTTSTSTSRRTTATTTTTTYLHYIRDCPSTSRSTTVTSTSSRSTTATTKQHQKDCTSTATSRRTTATTTTYRHDIRQTGLRKKSHESPIVEWIRCSTKIWLDGNTRQIFSCLLSFGPWVNLTAKFKTSNLSMAGLRLFWYLLYQLFIEGLLQLRIEVLLSSLAYLRRKKFFKCLLASFWPSPYPPFLAFVSPFFFVRHRHFAKSAKWVING